MLQFTCCFFLLYLLFFICGLIIGLLLSYFFKRNEVLKFYELICIGRIINLMTFSFLKNKDKLEFENNNWRCIYGFFGLRHYKDGFVAMRDCLEVIGIYLLVLGILLTYFSFY